MSWLHYIYVVISWPLETSEHNVQSIFFQEKKCSFISKAFNSSKKTSTPHEDEVMCSKEKKSVTKIKCLRLCYMLSVLNRFHTKDIMGCLGCNCFILCIIFSLRVRWLLRIFESQS